MDPEETQVHVEGALREGTGTGDGRSASLRGGRDRGRHDDFRCDGAGQASADGEADANGRHHEAGTGPD